MTADLVPAIFTIDIGDRPTVTFEAQNLREARKLCHEHWLKEDLAEAKSGGVPLWDGKAKLRARLSLPEEFPRAWGCVSEHVEWRLQLFWPRMSRAAIKACSDVHRTTRLE